jgi:FtsZ-binding cell division protein ZapB
MSKEIDKLKETIRIIEQETIADMKICEGVATVALQSNNKLVDAVTNGNKKLKERLKRNNDSFKSSSVGFKAKIRRWLGIEAIEKRQIDDFRILIEFFNVISDDRAKFTPDDVAVVLSIMAIQLDKQAEALEDQDKEDLEKAAISVRRMADRFMRNKEGRNDKN